MFPKVKIPKTITYLDNAAATPMAMEVKKAMEPFYMQKFGNPSSLYKQGREAKAAVEQARQNIALLINAKPSEIIFTAGGSESVNLAIFGVARIYQNSKISKHQFIPHFITTAIEHHCVLNSFKALEGEGFNTTVLPVNQQGVISLVDVKKNVRKETVFISVMLANNEIGSIEPVQEIAHWLKGENAKRKLQNLPVIILHTDACQAAGFLNIDVNFLGVDLMSVNGSKVYGPKQTGFLFARTGLILKPLIYGGGQEKDLRGGTENVAGIVGLAKALELVSKSKEKENSRLAKLASYLSGQIQSRIPNVLLNGSGGYYLKVNKQLTNELIRLPNNVNFSFKGAEGESLMLYLDSYNIAVSTASACSTGNADPSHVLLALGRSKDEAQSAIRFSLGKQTTKQEINYLLKILPKLVSELRKLNKNK